MKKMKFILIAAITLGGITACQKEDSTPTEKHLVLNLQPDGETGKDAVFSKIKPDNNYGDLKDIHLYAWTQNGGTNINRVAIDFDLSAIPQEAQIDSAFLSLYFDDDSNYGTEHKGDNSFMIQRITSDWDESTITWNTQPNTTEVNQVNVSSASLPTQDFTDIKLTDLIIDLFENKDNRHGLMLKLENEVVYKLLLIASSDNPNETIRPKLDVYYSITE
ncbi:DNRLRE domain-containing protein [Carboxylicivirga linearis]|uniref:DNRLRE domain-containing protein n=1 Tax=Carboxylicivirga linearis TaxID=1628157 RepID=A0ABS5JZH1_9BACT|nr:DNRLRE domain-containing protein [Carboxylicivirga linearis]MBS2100293.1 DNRLRE domain-containing protein [Carboxylicivirga linearis]